MTYYEEFAINSSATVDEIRHSHRRLIKILHPDLHSDCATRALAEVQTRRINGIAAVLLDPTTRKTYDDGLKIAPMPIAKRHDRTVTFAMAGVCVLLGLWLLQVDRPVVIAHEAASGSATEPAPKPATAPAQRTTGREARPTSSPRVKESDERLPDPPVQETVDQTDRAPGSFPVEASKVEAEKAGPVAIRETAEVDHNLKLEQKTSPGPTDKANPYVGTWIYVPAPESEDDSKLYRPEYIEMRIRAVKGAIEGQYRARYHVPDRPLSPNVGFHFLGPPGTAPSNAFHWSGSNGLAGSVELRLMTANSIQVDWRVTELAASADLVSGTAILTRVQ